MYLLFLGNNSVKTFSRQRRIIGGDAFYAFRLMSKESRRLIPPRISDCLISLLAMTHNEVVLSLAGFYKFTELDAC